MRFDELFEQRSLVASKLKECIRDKGYTKVSFASKAGISCSTLDMLLNGSMTSKSTYECQLQKVLTILDMSAEELMFYHSISDEPVASTLFSLNACFEHETKEQYDLLLDVIDLCAIYY